MQNINLKVLGLQVHIECRDPASAALIIAGYSAFVCTNSADKVDLEYSMSSLGNSGEFEIKIASGEKLTAEDDAHLLFLFEKDMTINAQKLRKDLYFLHAGAVRLAGKVAILVAASGTGKSTLTWALLQHGFEYLSDELAPIDIEEKNVVPYPHAICLKADPPAPYLLPAETLRTRSTLHVPVSVLENFSLHEDNPVAAIFFLTREAQSQSGNPRKLDKAEALMRLYTNTLNALAHGNEGLDAAAKITNNVDSYELNTRDLPFAIDVITGILQR